MEEVSDSNSNSHTMELFVEKEKGLNLPTGRVQRTARNILPPTEKSIFH